MKQHVDWKSLGLLLITVLFWASAFAGIRAALSAYSPEHLALLRFAVASLVMLALAVVYKVRLPNWRDLPWLWGLGLSGVALYQVLLGIGEHSVSAGVASLLVATSPIFTTLLASAVLKESFAPAKWLGVVLGFGGVATIALTEGGGLQLSSGALLVLLAALNLSVYSVMQKPLLQQYRPLEITSYAIWLGTLSLLVFAPGLTQAVIQAPVAATLAVVYMGVFPGALAYIAWSLALSRVPAATAGSFQYLTPVFALIIAWLWLGEWPSSAALMGGTISLLGVILTHRLGQGKPPLVARPAHDPQS